MRIFRRILVIAISILAACGPDAEKPSESGAKAPPKSTSAPKDTSSTEEPPPPPPEGRGVIAYRDGEAEEMTEPEAIQKGYTVIDFSNFWVPFIFSEKDDPGDERLRNTFRPVFRKLANDWPYESRTMTAAREVVEKRIEAALNAKIAELRDAGVPEHQINKKLGIEDKEEDTAVKEGTPEQEPEETFEGGLGESDNFLEVYGIPPSFSVLRKRALTEIDRDCYNELDWGAIERYDGFVSYKNNDVADADSKKGRNFAKKMRDEMERLGVEDPLELKGRKDAKASVGLLNLAMKYEATIETQKLLVCEELYKEGADQTYRKGGLDWKTHLALVAFERKSRIFGWGFIGKDTLVALRKKPDQRLYDSFIRVVAERVIDATGVIEDGSAKGEDGAAPKYKDENGAEREVQNLVAEYTNAVMRHLGLGTPDKVIEFLRSKTDKEFDELFVAVPLPERPPYHSAEMDLFAEIDRGDVWYDYPYTMDGKRKGQPRNRMPRLTLYTKWNEQNIPLVNMGTTIGGWRTEAAADGYEYYKYKNSDVGPRVWKDIVSGPVWLPPDTTPGKDLIKTVRYRGRLVSVPNYDEVGPWYASAYGLVVAFHVRPVERNSGELVYFDNGIRAHGSVDYNSILRRFSHGCHRLYNHLAIRLFDFVLRHREYTRVGQIPAGYSRKITTEEDTYFLDLDSKGYKYELKNPVPVNVLWGRVRGAQRSPIQHYMPKPGAEYGDDAQFLPEEYLKAKEEAEKDAGVEETAEAETPAAEETPPT